MRKLFSRKNEEEALQTETDIAGLINKLQQQVVSLEKKIDTLVAQSSERSSERKHFAKPFKRFERNNRYERGNRSDSVSENRFFKVICADCKKECKVPFKPRDNRPIYCNDCFSKRKDDNR